VGVDLGLQGYAVVRIDRVTGRDPLVSDTSRATSQYSQAWSDAETRAYYASLRDRFKARVNDKELAKLIQSGSGEGR
jgi:peptidyl-prolyl cis-trans isomerase D